MDCFFIKIHQNVSSYGEYVLQKEFIREYNYQHLIENQIVIPSKLKAKFQLDGIFLHYFIQELKIGKNYRISFVKKLKRYFPKNVNSLIFILSEPLKQIIDYKWNYMIEVLVREKSEIENLFSWLSTLGGAFSALGDYYFNCAEIAGKISVNQFKLALRLGDDSIISRCKLFLSLSLIQQKRFCLAKHIIYQEYYKAKNATILDDRLIRMCLGIWAKLQYEHKLKHNIIKRNNTNIHVK